MKKINLISRLMLGAAVTSLSIFSSCKKDSDNADDFQSTSQEMGQAESVSNDVDGVVSEGMNVKSGSISGRSASSEGELNSGCATVVNDSVNHILTITFNNCQGAHGGHVRNGIITVTYSPGAGYFIPGSSWTISFDNYYVDGKHMEGTRTVTNEGYNSAGNMHWSVNAVNMRVTRTDGSTRTWNSTRDREMVAGLADDIVASPSPDAWIDDVYVINGTVSSVHRDGETCNAQLLNLRKQLSCPFFVSGSITVTPSGKVARTIDFGNGDCDNIATVTKNGVTKTIMLR